MSFTEHVATLLKERPGYNRDLALARIISYDLKFWPEQTNETELEEIKQMLKRNGYAEKKKYEMCFDSFDESQGEDPVEYPYVVIYNWVTDEEVDN